MGPTRRRVLELGGAVLATVPLAGCPGGETGTDPAEEAPPSDGGTASTTARTGTPPDSTTATGTSAGGRPATDTAGATEWLPAPSAVEFVPEAGYAFRAVAPAQLVELSDALGDGATDRLTREVPNPGIETLADATLLLQFARSAVAYEADFDRATVESEFEELGFSAVDTYQGFTLVAAGETRVGAVSDEAVVTVGRFSSEETTDKRPATEAVIDAKTGNGERYADAIPDCGTLVDALGAAHVVQGRTHEAGATFEGAVGEGVSTHVGPEDSRVRASVVFAEAADESAVAEWASGAETFDGREPATRVDGRVVTAEAAVPSGDLGGFPSEFPGPPIATDTPSVPRVEFGFEYAPGENGQGTLAITHNGGDAVAADQLFVRGSGFADVESVDQTAAGPWKGTASGDDDSVIAGDEVTVGVASDYQVRVVWEADDAQALAILGGDQGPDA
jgi:hypothetical protein